MQRVITERQLKKFDHKCPICDSTMIEEQLAPTGPKCIYLICESCNIIADYYFIKEDK